MSGSVDPSVSNMEYLEFLKDLSHILAENEDDGHNTTDGKRVAVAVADEGAHRLVEREQLPAPETATVQYIRLKHPKRGRPLKVCVREDCTTAVCQHCKCNDIACQLHAGACPNNIGQQSKTKCEECLSNVRSRHRQTRQRAVLSNAATSGEEVVCSICSMHYGREVFCRCNGDARHVTRQINEVEGCSVAVRRHQLGQIYTECKRQRGIDKIKEFDNGVLHLKEMIPADASKEVLISALSAIKPSVQVVYLQVRV